MDGVEAARQIQERFGIPVLYLTAYSDITILERAKSVGPAGYLLKPFESRDLLVAIETALYKHELEKKLKESERWLATTLSSIGDAVIAADAEGRIKFLNPVAEALTGWPQAEALGKNLSQVFGIINEETRQPAADPVARAMREGTVVGLANHTLLVARGGQEIPIADSAAPIRDDGGNIIGVVLIFRDVTERRRAEKALQASEATLTSIFRAAPTGMGVVSERVLLQVNDRLCEMTGYSREELVGKSARVLYPSDEDYEYVGREKYAQIRAWGIGSVETRWQRKDGTVIDVLLSSSPFNLDDLSRGVTFTALDITERKRTQEALLASEERYRRITQAVTDYIYTVRVEDGRPVETTHGAGCVAVTGYASEEFAADAYLWIRMVVDKDRAAIQEQARRVLAGEDVPPVEHQIIRKDGVVRWVRNTVVSHRDAEGKLFAYDGLIQDVTERKQAEEALRESEERFRRRSAELQALYNISLRLNTQLETPGLLHLIVEQAAALLGVDTGCLYTYDPQRDELTMSVGVGRMSEFVGRTLKPGDDRRLMWGEHPRAGRAAPREKDESFDLTLTMPLLGAAGVLGILDLGGGEQGRAFDDHDVWLTELFAAQAAVALENARLYAETQRYTQSLTHLNRISQAIISTLDEGAVWQLLINGARALLDAQATSVLLHDPAGDELVFAAVSAPGDDVLLGARMPSAAGIAGAAFREKRSILVRDAQQDGRFYAHIDAQTGMVTHSLLAVPVAFKGQVTGVVEALNKAGSGFDERDVGLLEALTTSATIAIENIHLVETERNQSELAETLREVGTTMASVLERDTLLDRLLELVDRVATSDAANLMLIESDYARVIRHRGYERFGADSFMGSVVYHVPDVPYLRQMLETGQPFAIPDTRNDPSWVSHPQMAWLRSYAAAPICVRGQVMGFLNIDSATPGFFNQSHAEHLYLFASQAGVAFENARLFSSLDQEKERLELLHYLSQKLVETLDVGEVAYRALDGLCAIVGALYGIVWVYEPDSDALLPVAMVGADISLPTAQEQARLRLGEGLSGWAAAHRQMAVSPDVTTDERWVRHPGMGELVRSALSVPLISGDELVGVFTVGSVREAFFDQATCHLVESAAGMVAVAVANARLFQAEREQYRRLQESQARLVLAEKMAALGRLTASFAHEINNPLQAVQGFLELIEEEAVDLPHLDKVRRYLSITHREIDRIAVIVHRMRDFYHPSHEGMQPTDVHVVLDAILELTGKQLQHSRIVVERDWGDVPLIQANPDYLRQVFLNLVLNAVDAMAPGESDAKPGGVLRVRTMPDWMKKYGDQPAPAVRIEFTDTGAGMPPEALAHLFDPFFTTKRGGGGLGLSISYGIVEAHGGQITAASRPGEGTTFTVMLPVEQP